MMNTYINSARPSPSKNKIIEWVLRYVYWQDRPSDKSTDIVTFPFMIFKTEQKIEHTLESVYNNKKIKKVY